MVPSFLILGFGVLSLGYRSLVFGVSARFWATVLQVLGFLGFILFALGFGLSFWY